jgi:hypothetical protein
LFCRPSARVGTPDQNLHATIWKLNTFHFLLLQRLIQPSRRVYIHVFYFVYSHARRFVSVLLVRSPPVAVSRSRRAAGPHSISRCSVTAPSLLSGMDGASSSASSSASRPRKGVRLRPLRRRRGPATTLASRGGDGEENGGGGAHDDLALPLGMSFAAVLARVCA